MQYALFFAGLIVGIVAMLLLQKRPRPAQEAVLPEVAASDEPVAIEADTPGTAPAADRLHALKRALDAHDDAIKRPEDLLTYPEFEQGVALLASDAFDAGGVLEELTSAGYVAPCMAAAALSRRSDTDPARVQAAAAQLGGYAMHFVLDYLKGLPDAAALPVIAMHAREWWWEYSGFRADFRRYLQWAANREVPAPDAGAIAKLEDGPLEEARTVLRRFDDPLLAALLECMDADLKRRNERRVLGEVGRIGTRKATTPRLEYPALRERVAMLRHKLEAADARPLLLVGDHGVGKTALLDVLEEQLGSEGWLLFDASAADVLAGQKYIGELEGRVREMLATLHRPRALWRIQDFHDLLHKGSHARDRRGILDLLLPAVERGELLLVGEITPAQYAQLLVARPAVRHLFDAVAMPAVSAAELEEIGACWAEAAATRHGQPVADAATLAEARRIAAQFFPDHNEPGRSLRLLDDAVALATRDEPATLPLGADRLLAAVGTRSGLPLDVIDPGQRLSLERLRDFFRARVVGQDDAVECLVDRIAMLKAGLTDSRRPIGVFLFAGPTGTGKTELAKALGELLFGSDERLLRLDMSEFQSHDATQRLLAGGGEDGTRSLVSRIREQPFSVILLDEFEKAHPSVWDLFLQVFDDARLSDQQGNAADFRHSIIILTSNVGSTLSRSAGPGFLASAGGYSRSSVETALYQTFRREFINRLDRVVLFRPLDRAAMRGILHKELARALERRGLRNRAWAVEWEPSAIDFLLDRGFTPDLGARPLRRAIEDHLLAPLARSIVEHQAPEGDQFLFVRSGDDRLDVEFIDPDAPAQAAATRVVRNDAETGDLRALMYAALDASPDPSVLAAHHDALHAQVRAAAWQDMRDADFAEMDAQGFWSDPGRAVVLDRIERRDRIDAGLEQAGRLLERLQRTPDATLATRVLQLLFLLQLGIDELDEGLPQDAVLTLSLKEADRLRGDMAARQWWQRLLQMYLQWGERRGMKISMRAHDAERGQAQLLVSGFGAHHLLQGESGLHVLESENDGGSTQRWVVQVGVAADGPGAVSEPPNTDGQAIARRYREEPSPLVRDTRRGWRSGRLDRVLGGHFDIMQ